MLALTMGIGSLSAHATPVSYDLNYNPFFPNNIHVDVTIFLDDADITGGTVDVPLTSIEVRWRKGNNEILFSFPNTQMGINTVSPSSAFFAERKPFTAHFVGGDLKGLNGLQEPVVAGIANLSFVTPQPVVGGSQAFAQFSGVGLPVDGLPGEANGLFDISNLNSVSGPTSAGASAPEPATLALFGLVLAGLCFSRIIQKARMKWRFLTHRNAPHQRTILNDRRR